jgi:hypothetical protein
VGRDFLEPWPSYVLEDQKRWREGPELQLVSRAPASKEDSRER